MCAAKPDTVRSSPDDEVESVAHDKNFKNAIIDYLRPALLVLCPTEAGDLPASATFKLLRQEQVVEKLHWSFRETDVPVQVDLPHGEREAFVVGIEEETDASKFDIRRLAEYTLGSSRLFGTDRIVPVALFIGPGRVAVRLELGTEREKYLTFKYVACRLAEIPVESYWNTDNPFAALTLPLMDHEPQRHLEVCEHATDRFFDLEKDERKRAKYVPFIEQEGRMTRPEMVQFRHWLLHESRWRSDVENMFDEVRRDALKTGRTEGRTEGKAEGKAEAILLFLQGRRIALTDGQRERILACKDSDELNRWLGAAAVVASADELFPASVH